MGVPKFYRWISERYPCLSEVVREWQIPEFDNLYLDMNGIVHICSHPEDENPHFRITEEQIFSDIFHYIEFLYRMIKPRKVFFMAIDGVAPRAKMNQQRGRRFRSAREAEDLVRKALEKGEILPKEERFDSNCITPGTPFMVRLQEQLKYFVVKKVSTDPLWQGVRIYLSGHETPGEGEHKIMDFIRSERVGPDHDPNTRHCLYGLDADLIMLGLVSHEPHFSLLREEVRFGGKKSQQAKRSTTPEETTFHLLHLSLMREYLEFEFSSLKQSAMSFPFDVECIIDDWVMMGFLVGNDFIPHLPNLHIKSDALPYLWKAYMEVLPSLDGYINVGGRLNLKRFEKYLEKLAHFDISSFDAQYADMKWLESKVGGKAINLAAGRAKAKQEKKTDDNQFAALGDVEDEYEEMFPEEEEEEEDDEDDEEFEDEDLFSAEFRQHKAHYYKDKLEFKKVTPEVLRSQAEGYVRAIEWILRYYYEGCPSWSWFYPFHYAPYVSDIKNFSDMKLEFELGTPFLPFQQLMAVLPTASKNLLPKPFQKLMTMDTSPIFEFYPENFDTDLNGKQQDWEAVVLIPFIAEDRLLKAMEPCYKELSSDEKARNSHGPHLLYEHQEDELEVYTSAMPAFPDIIHNYARCTEIDKFGFCIDPSVLPKGLPPGCKLDVFFPGFPTLKHIQHRAELKKEQVKVFQQNSRGDNMMLQILENDSDTNIEAVANEVLGKSIFVNWPHLYEARVIEVSDDQVRYIVDETVSKKSKTFTVTNHEVVIKKESRSTDQLAIWHREVDSITEKYHSNRGVDVGPTFILVYAQPMMGRKYICGATGNITLEKQWAQNPVPFVYQATVKDIATHDPSFKQYKTLDQLFPEKSTVFMLGSPHYGCMGEVVDIDPKNNGRIRVNFTIPVEPNYEDIIRRQHSLATAYMPGYVLAQKLGLNSHFVSRITGCIFICRGNKEQKNQAKVNVGLNLKFNKKNQEVPGYTRKESSGWVYSDKTFQVIESYLKKFPNMFQAISSKDSSSDIYFESDIFTPESGESLHEVQDFIKDLPCSKCQPMAFGSVFVDELVIQEMEKEVERVKGINAKKKKRTKMQVRPHLLFRPLDQQGTLVPDPSTTYEMYDRIVNVREGYSVPVGARGTIVGKISAEKEADVMYEVVFDEELMGGLTIRCSANKGYRLPSHAMVNVTHGERKEAVKSGRPVQKPMAVVKPQKTQSERREEKIRASYSDLLRQNREQKNTGSYAEMAAQDTEQKVKIQQREEQAQSSQSKVGHSSPGQDHGHYKPPQFGSGGQFYTPKMSPREYTPQHQKGRGSQKSHKPPQAECEFTNMWKELQSAGLTDVQSPSGGMKQKQPKQTTPVKSKSDSGARKTNTQPKQDVPSLEQAVKALEKLPTPSTFEQKTEQADGTAIIKQMLNLSVDPPKTTEPKQEPKQSYGRQVSVQELFEGAQQQHSAEAAKQPRETLPGKRKKTAVHDLMDICKSREWPLARYEYFPEGNQWLSIVTLPNQLRFKGSVSRTKEQAAVSAASMAMKHMTSQANQRPEYGPYSVRMSPNSAFSPVRPVMQHPHGVPFRAVFQGQRPHQHQTGGTWQATPIYVPRQPNPNFQEQVRFYHQAPGQQPRHPGNPQQKGPQQDRPQPQHEVGKTTPQKSNPFIPMQVTKKSTPQKQSQKKVETKPVSQEPITTGQEPAASSSVPDPDGSVQSTRQKDQNNSAQVKHKQSAPKQTGNQKTGAEPSKTRKKRLAANFGGQ